MKIILSRKGFDSGSGGYPSPILPSGELCSLPIPEPISDIRSQRYEEIRIGNHSLGSLVNDLTQGKITPEKPAHLDPDLNFDSIARAENWKPIFGQAGAAETHLQNQGVKEGDIFVFFGLFRQVEQVAGKYSYVRGAPPLHIIFGWLQIEQRIPVDSLSEIPSWALNHPHCKSEKYGNRDSIYISSERIKLLNIDKPGAGTFKKFDLALCLTSPSASKTSIWQLPSWFHPKSENSSLSYHQNLTRWKLEDDYVLLNTVSRGQEFVLNCEEYPESLDWLCNILELCN
ncbi:MAG: hypothetical protein KME05_01160 [Gloeocapsa sp. UFS-A4-WI-NPMV-4B04]|jgi:hypothetical protein|nr:hypothetical protein [Gloeocapsa sp. UFS-A4-WI-NPMV-4B04]